MKSDEKSELVLLVERLMKLRGFTYRTLAEDAGIAISTMHDFKNGAMPREATLKRIAGPLSVDVDNLSKRIPKLYKTVKRVKVVLICGYCDEPGVIYTAAPGRVKYAHKKCVKAVSLKQSREKTKRDKKEGGYPPKKSKVRDMDRIRLIPQNNVYLESLKLKKLRKCLGGCEKMFMSESPGNRICRVCSKNPERSWLHDRTCKIVI